MRKLLWVAAPLGVLAMTTPAAAAKKSKVIQPLPPGVVGHVTVASTTVEIGETAKANADKLEAKAAEKRAAAKLPSAAGADAAVPRPATDRYATLPLAAMIPLEVEDVTHMWGLTSGRPVKLVVTIDSIKTANAGMALLLASNDELAGTVLVLDATSGEKLGEFYVDVLNTSAGWLGLALRGSGVREKLAAAFADQVAVQLSGSKHKPKPPAS